MFNQDSEFLAESRNRGLSNEDIKQYGGGFENPGSGKPDCRADLIAHNKNTVLRLLNNPEALENLKAALNLEPTN